MMTMTSRNDYLKTIRTRYHGSSKEKKSVLLDEYCANTGQNRKYAIRKLQPRVSLEPRERKKRTCTYTREVVKYLKDVWEIMDYPCGQRLEPQLSEWVDILREHNELRISDELANLLKKMGPATVDRKLRHEKQVQRRRHFSTTKPGGFLKDRIPVRLNDWNTQEVGNISLDLVAHCGGSVSGDYVNTISGTDIATGWWEGEAIMGKGQERTRTGVDRMRKRSPFAWRGIHPDNGSEFLNAHMLRYTEGENLEFSRSRPNKKNDNCYVEQKNWTHVRKILGYLRYDSEQERAIINDLYRNDLRLYKNFFQPVMKLQEKTRAEGRLHRRYEKAKTPYQRVLELAHISENDREELTAFYRSLNPAEIKRRIDWKVRGLEKAYDAKMRKRMKETAKAKKFSLTPVSSTVTF